MKKMERERIPGKKGAYYELGIVILLGLLFGLVTLNRLTIVYLFPSIMTEIKISYTQIGALTAILSVVFAISTLFFAGLSDRVGRKIILVPAAILFSIMSWLSGVTYSFLQLLLVRGSMGIGQGPILPASVATIAAESTPARRGFNFGLHASLTPLVAFGIGAIVVTRLSEIMSWRMAFLVVAIPVFIIAVILCFYMREPKLMRAGHGGNASEAIGEKPGFFTPLKYRNVILSSIVQFLMWGSVFVFMTFSLIYLTKELALSISDAGIIVSCLGFGGFFGCILLPLLSDHVGRKPVLIPSLFILGLCFLGFMVFGSNFFLLGGSILIAGFVLGGIGPLAVSALTTESVPPHLAATAAGIPISVGEILGAGLMPYLAGYLSDLYGLKAALLFAVFAPIIGGVVGFFYKETAPKIIARKVALANT